MRTKEQLESMVRDRLHKAGKDGHSHIILELCEQCLQNLRDMEAIKSDKSLLERISKKDMEISSLKNELKEKSKRIENAELLVELLKPFKDEWDEERS